MAGSTVSKQSIISLVESDLSGATSSYGRPRYDVHTRKVWVFGKLGWFTYFLVCGGGPHVKGFNLSRRIVRELGIKLNFDLAFSL